MGHETLVKHGTRKTIRPNSPKTPYLESPWEKNQVMDTTSSTPNPVAVDFLVYISFFCIHLRMSAIAQGGKMQLHFLKWTNQRALDKSNELWPWWSRTKEKRGTPWKTGDSRTFAPLPTGFQMRSGSVGLDMSLRSQGESSLQRRRG